MSLIKWIIDFLVPFDKRYKYQFEVGTSLPLSYLKNREGINEYP